MRKVCMISEKGNTRGNDFMCHPDFNKTNFDWKGGASALIQNPQFYRFLWTKRLSIKNQH